MSDNPFEVAALAYAARGWAVFPCKPGAKEPATTNGVKDASTDPEQIRRWWAAMPRANPAIATGTPSGVWAIDPDIHDGKDDGLAILAALERQHGLLPRTTAQCTGSGGQHRIFRMNGTEVRNSAGKLGPGIDVRGNGGYVLLPPSVHPNGSAYEWIETCHPADIAPADAPPWLYRLLAETKQTASGNFNTGGTAPKPDDGGGFNFFTRFPALFNERAIAARITSGADYHVASTQLLGCWASHGVAYLDALHRLTGLFEQIPEDNRDQRWRARYADIARCTADIYGYEAAKADAAAAVVEDDGETPPEAEEDFDAEVTLQLSDDALALEFSTRHAGVLRYCHQWGSWLLWDGARWKFEHTLRVFDLARAVARERATASKTLRAAPKVASAATVAAIERLARSDRRHATETNQWDADQWFLNTPGGLIDLHSGETLPHDSARYITKITAVAPGGECPRWLKFLEEVTGGNVELQTFLQRFAGYSLTGNTREHALFFFYGTGGNGKGVFLNTLAAIMEDYSVVAPMETFIATNNDRHPTDLAGLRGARLVTSQETEEGRHWAEPKIKALTGGDPITARFMRQDFFTYVPAFKLAIAGNHKPALRGVDEAIKRRFHLVPFTVTITNPDRDLPDKLREEWPGILRWAIDGCLEWQAQGLSPPAIVLDATAAYLGEEDAISRWVEECCVTGPQQWCASSLLWSSWQRWAGSAGETVGSSKRFSMNLESHGYLFERTMLMRGFRGLDLIASEKPRVGGGAAEPELF